MFIKFLKDVDLQIVDAVQDDDNIDTSENAFEAGEVHDVDIVGETDGTVDIQFGDGSVAFSVARDWVEITDENPEVTDDEGEFEIEFSVVYRTRVKCRPSEIEDRVFELEIPESDEIKYVTDSMELETSTMIIEE